jgi:hypothetical protein
VAERGPIERTPSGRVWGLAAPEVNLLSNMAKERCEQLTTWPLKNEHSILQQHNLANNLHRLIFLCIKKRRKHTKKQGKNPKVKKTEML